MKITRFYTAVLGANLANPQWSWGAKDPMTNRIYLRVWEDQIQQTSDGERVQVCRDVPVRKSNGYPERKAHLAQIENGAEGFGVVCTAVDTNPDGPREIGSFDNTTRLRLGGLENADGITYARIDGRVPVSELAHQRTAQSTLAEDIKSILAKKIEPTTKEALVNARVGQGKFRVQVLRLWRNRCCVTGAITQDAIRASHIKPWSESNDEERLDPHNGLPLVASLDALFDAGLISFEDSGKLLVSPKLNDSEREIFCVSERTLSKVPPPETAKYLAYHRGTRFDQ